MSIALAAQAGLVVNKQQKAASQSGFLARDNGATRMDTAESTLCWGDRPSQLNKDVKNIASERTERNDSILHLILKVTIH